MKKYNIAVIGATGNVGGAMLRILAERNFPVGDVYALASAKSKGKIVAFGDKRITVEDLDKFDFKGKNITFAFSSPGGAISAKYSPKMADAGVIVIDNTSHFRMEEDIPLVVPEVNPQDLDNYKKRNIIANPNCSTIQMVVALKPLHDKYKIKRVVVSTYQAVSGAGKAAMDELFDQSKAIAQNSEVEVKQFTKQIAFNCIPHIDKFLSDGKTKEEWKMEVETKKILDPSIEISATCVRVPVFTSHAESVNIEFENDFKEEDIMDLMSNADGIALFDKREDGGYITPFETGGQDLTFVSRIRRDTSNPKTLNMWISSDNVRKGAALNTIQIAEEMIKRKLI
jgi:aspartate-semialdehyde dehydrogenase